MVTKSEEDATLQEAIGADIREYLVKPVNPRQVLTVITRVLEGPRIRQQAVARAFTERFRDIQYEGRWPTDWRGWIERFAELMRWDIDLAEAGETGLYDALKTLYADMHREFAEYVRRGYPVWVRDLSGESAEVVAGERARVATEGWGARLLERQRPDGMWGDGVAVPQWLSTLDTLVLLWDMGLDPTSEQARGSGDRSTF